MKVRFAWIFAALAAVPVLAHAQSATGAWTGEFTPPGGPGGGGGFELPPLSSLPVNNMRSNR